MLQDALERTEVKINDKKMDCDSYTVGQSSIENNKLEITIYIEGQKPYRVIIEVLASNPNEIITTLEKEIKSKIYPKRTPEELTARQLRIANGEILVDCIDIDEIIDTCRNNNDITINVKALDE